MDNIWIVILTSLISGLLATILTIICQRKFEIKRTKKQIFETLMSHRYLIVDKENVEALNKVDVVFYHNTEVRKAWKAFLNAADTASVNPMAENEVNDKYLRLLEEIAKCIGYKNINWEDIKKYYLPKGLSTQIAEETALRKAQLQQATMLSGQDQMDSRQISSEEMGMRFVLKALETPNGMDNITKLLEMASMQGKMNGGKRK